MKRTIGALLVAAAGAFPACGGSSSPAASTPPATQWPSVNICSVLAGQVTAGAAIISTDTNGSSCPAPSPSVVKLNMRGDGTGGTCSGTVIDRRTVLTAAHCVKDFTSISVTFGTTDVFTSTSFPRMDTIDVAVVLTDRDFPQKPFALITRAVNKGDPAIVAGYGAGAQGGASGMLRGGWTTITSPDSVTLETQYTPGTTSGVCYGDSGGPLLAQDSGGSWAVAGVTSTLSGNGCATSATTNQFVNVRNPAVAAFILGLPK